MFKICELWTVIWWYELNPRVRCAFGNVFLFCCLSLSSEAGLMSQDNSSDKAVYTIQGFSGEAKFVFWSTMQWKDPLIQSVCGRRERKYSTWKRKENCKMNELGIRGCKRWTRPDLKIRNSQTRAVNEWGIGIFSKIYNDHIYSPTQPAYAGPQGQPMELQGLKISDIVHIFLGDNHVAVELLPLACCKTQTLSKWIWTLFYKLNWDDMTVIFWDQFYHHKHKEVFLT